MKPDRSKAITLLVTAEPLSMRGLRHLFQEDGRWPVVAAAGSIAEARVAWRRLPVALVVVDVAVDGGEALAFIAECVKERPGTAVVVWTGREDAESVRRALTAGARGYVSRRDAEGDLLRTVEEALAGKRHMGARIEQVYLEDAVRGGGGGVAGRKKLSAQEHEMYARCAEGKSARAMAKDMGLSPKTVETHLRRIREKWGVPTTRALQLMAMLEARTDGG